MRFQPTVKIMRGPIDAVPLAAVLFLLLMFVLLSSQYVFVPGVAIRLPEEAGGGGGSVPATTTGPTVAVAVDAAGRIYFDNQAVSDKTLEAQLAVAVKSSTLPLTLVVMADRAAKYETVARLGSLAKKAGIKQALFAIRPRLEFPTQAEPGP